MPLHCSLLRFLRTRDTCIQYNPCIKWLIYFKIKNLIFKNSIITIDKFVMDNFFFRNNTHSWGVSRYWMNWGRKCIGLWVFVCHLFYNKKYLLNMSENNLHSFPFWNTLIFKSLKNLKSTLIFFVQVKTYYPCFRCYNID